MTPEVLKAYKSVFAECLTAVSDEFVPALIRQIESIEDEAIEFNELLSGENAKNKAPTHWISVFRFIRFAQGRILQIRSRYDGFVNLYQTLSSMEVRNPDQEQLLKETGDFLYSADEITGEVERTCLKLLKGVRNGMVKTYGIVLTPKEEMYADLIPREIHRGLDEGFKELVIAAQKIKEQVQIMEALSRIQSFILS